MLVVPAGIQPRRHDARTASIPAKVTGSVDVTPNNSPAIMRDTAQETGNTHSHPDRCKA